MEFENPSRLNVAIDIHEAYLLKIRLADFGIPAVTVEDYLQAVPEIWVSESRLEEAWEVIWKFEESRTAQREKEKNAERTWRMIDAVCETCGETTQYAEEFEGKVEVCPKCGDFVDVGAVEWNEADYADIDADDSPATDDDSKGSLNGPE